MIVVSLKRLLISLLLITLTTVILTAVGLKIYGGEDWYLKMDLQNFFFWGITVLIAQILIGSSLIISHKKIMRNIHRLSAVDDFTDARSEKSFREMGEIGDEVRKIIKRAGQLSVMRADRISALNNLADLLCEGYSEPVMVTDVNGVIFTLSDKLKSKISKEANSADISNITDLRSDLKLSEILGFIEKQRTAWKDSDSSGLICSPVFDKNGAVQFCIWEFETSFFAGKIKEPSQQKSKNRPSYTKFREFLNPRQLRKKEPRG